MPYEMTSTPFDEAMIGKSDAFLEFQEKLRLAAKVDRHLLIVGERGSGKSTAAKCFHTLSKRKSAPFVELFCPAHTHDALDEALLGNDSGCLKAAHHGLLYIHEISVLPRHVQEKLRQYLQSGMAAGLDHAAANARIVASSSRNLLVEAHQERFSSALLDLLSFEALIVPPLRERQEDIALLANAFAVRMMTELGRRHAPEFTEAAMAQMMRYRWPGNVRELRTVVERAVARSDSPQIAEIEFQPLSSWVPPHEAAYRGEALLRDGAQHWDESRREAITEDQEAGTTSERGFLGELADMSEITLPGAVRKLEIHFLRRALKLSHFNQKVAAEALGLSYDQFRGLYRKYGDELKEGRE